jgi:hypothetical protein
MLAAAWLLMLPEWAAAQCTSSANAADESLNGSVILHAATTQQGCGGVRTVYVRAWIENLSSACHTGSQTPSGYCVNQNADGNAGVTMGNLAYGTWWGHSSHWYIQGGVATNLEGRDVLLDAGPPPPSPQEECEAMGWVWNYETQSCDPPPNCPIIIATAKNATYKLTSADDGVWFDIDADGVIDKVAWTEPDSDVAFLALDRDGDGQITSGRELFGNHTIPGVTNGFEALRQTARDTNNGVATASVGTDDPLFGRLVLWTDSNHNGASEPYELRPVTESLAEIGLGYQLHNRKDGHGNQFVLRGWASIRTAPGRNRSKNPKESDERRRTIYDVVLVTMR